ncbi:hypothetical protein Bca101_072067 [Brassica carinata]
MCSKRKSSTKSRHDRSVPDGSSSRHVDVIPKVEFPAEPTDSEEVDAWRTAMGEVKPPIPVVWVPPPFKTNPVAGCPSRSCPNGLVAIRLSTTFYQVPEGLPTVRELLRGRPCFWADFSPKRVRRAVGLYRSRFRPNMPTKEGSESSMDGFIPYVPRTKKDRSKPCKDKHIMVDEDVVDGQFSPDNILKDYLDSQAGGSNEVLDFSKAARMVNGGLLMINRALDTSKQDAQMARFKAEVADKEIARLKDELEIFSSPGATRRLWTIASFVEPWVACILRSFPTTRFLAIPVSPNLGIPDTAESGGLDETGEVDQPVAPLDVNDYSIGRLMSGNFDLGD